MNYRIRAIHRQSANSHYAYNDYAFPRDMADNIVKANRLLHPDHVWSVVAEDSLSGMGDASGTESMKPLFTSVELHLSAHDASWTSKFGLRVKRAGGEYSSIRGGKTCRCVTIPVHALEAEKLISAIITHEIDRNVEMGREAHHHRNSVPMLARGVAVEGFTPPWPAWVTVHHYGQAVHDTAEVEPLKWLIAMVWVSVAQAIFTNSLTKELSMVTVPMITVPPPTPITATDRVARVLDRLERAINIMLCDNIHNTPLWSMLQDARMEAQSAFDKLP
jgi:hypothetical protein